MSLGFAYPKETDTLIIEVAAQRQSLLQNLMRLHLVGGEGARSVDGTILARYSYVENSEPEEG